MVKVKIPNTNDEREHPAGIAVQVVDGVLAVNGPAPRSAGLATLAVYAPGEWRSAVVADE